MNTDEYSHEIGRRVVQDIANVAGFHGIRQNACDLFVDVLQRCKYFNFNKVIVNIGQKSLRYAQLCHRNEPNIHDVLSSLSEIGLDYTEFSKYLSEFEYGLSLEPFESGIPKFPKDRPSKLLMREEPKEQKEVQKEIMTPPTTTNPQEPQKIPSFLPPFPPKHTYTYSPMFNERTKDQNSLQKMKTKQKRQLESSLTKLHVKELKKELTETKQNDTKEDVPLINPYLIILQKKTYGDYDKVGEISSVETIDVDFNELPENSKVSVLLAEKKKRRSEREDKEGNKRKCDEIIEMNYKSNSDLTLDQPLKNV